MPNPSFSRRSFCAAAAAAALLAGRAGAQAAFSSRRIAVRTVGSGPDVVLIPGLAASRDVWSDTIAAVPGYRFHLVQVAGFAGWPAAANAQGPVVRPVAEEIARYIREAGLRRPALVGHSMGGTLAMMIAARHPGLVGKLMVVDMLPQPAGLFGSSPDQARSLADMLGDIAATPGGRGLVGSLVAFFNPGNGASARSDPEVVTQATHELALTDLKPDLPSIRAPMTVVYASADAQHRATADRTYATAYRDSGATLVRIDDSGHMIMLDQPQAFTRALKAFLKP